jgi:hypothetical protein
LYNQSKIDEVEQVKKKEGVKGKLKKLINTDCDYTKLLVCCRRNPNGRENHELGSLLLARDARRACNMIIHDNWLMK